MVTRNAPFSSVFRWRARHQPSSAGPLPPPAAASHPRVSRSIGRVTPIRWLSPANNLPPQPSCLRAFVYTRISSAGVFFFPPRYPSFFFPRIHPSNSHLPGWNCNWRDEFARFLKPNSAAMADSKGFTWAE